MIDTSGKLDFLSADVPANWISEPSQYTDLNAPVQTPGLFGPTIYPIVDTTALTNQANQNAGTQVTGVSSDTSVVTMPVAWLYELQDGTLGPASNGTSTNPIVARVAFWTDDDTSKININTAGVGSPWNTPHLNSTNDLAWSTNQPAVGEYSAYGGHPATTSLALVFGTNAYSSQQLLGLTPRYAWGGSQFGTQATTVGEVVPTKMDRLYASLDELCFSTNTTGTPSQRQENPVTAAQLEDAKFVLTTHSVAPETTLLGEPRIAIWPVADSTSTSAPQITAADRAITNAATVGIGTTNARSYFFERHNSQSATDDLDTNIVPSNAQLFTDLVARGNLSLPGYDTTLSSKYSGPTWTQLMLEIVDFIRGINAVDPSPAPFVPYAAGDSMGLGHGFVVPLTTTYGSGASQLTLRGLGRCPTLSSLTLVFYVSGFNFDNKVTPSYIDYEETPDDMAGTSWNTYFTPSSTYWQHVVSERIRAFVVPCTFQPGCGYPEVSDACDIAVQGLNGIGMSNATANDFGFPSTSVASPLLCNPLAKLTAARAWGGNEGPITWRAIGDALANGTAATYPFAGTKPYIMTMPTKPSYSTTTGKLTWPGMANVTFYGLNPLTVMIRDRHANALQTIQLYLPKVSFPPPTILNEYDHRDGSTPDTSTADWASNTSDHVFPSYYMTLKNRLLATQNNRVFLIQPGDATRGIEANDLRVVASLATVPAVTNAPAALLQTVANYTHNVSQAHNLSFADGTSVLNSFGPTSLVKGVSYSTATNSVVGIDWRDGKTPVTNSWYTTAPCSAPSAVNGVTMQPVQNVNGDWDTGPGYSPDGAQINLPDAGTTNVPSSAYFSLAGGNVGAPTQRTPNALVPSPVIFGSLPAGIDPRDSVLYASNPTGNPASEPWRTLLFCPYPAANNLDMPYAVHPGAASPPDHVILDNFWMPVVEPYAISTCMATAGKINLNDQIAPFTYLHRNTALRALLDNLRIPTIPASMAGTYKSIGTPLTTAWKPVDEDATIAQIENRFTAGSVDAYLSESEICAVPIAPTGVVAPGTSVTDAQATLHSFWNGVGAPGGLTGDNLRELPYAQLYGRLTTRSNSYTVHIHVQILKKLPHDPNQNIWNEGVDLIQGDWRGSYEIERYLDPAAPAPAAGSPLGPYKFRILSSRRFAP